MTSRPVTKSPPTHRHRGAVWLPAVGLLLGVLGPASASATLTSIRSVPEAPTTCDSVALVVSGTMPNPCYHLIGAEISGPEPLPTMSPIPTYGIRVRITVQEPNPEAGAFPCPAVLQPYERQFVLGLLPPGRYWVTGIEYLIPFSSDSSAAPKDSSVLNLNFDVSLASRCPPPAPLGCFILDFGGPTDFCQANGSPGGTACADLVLMNQALVGGIQTELEILDRRRDPSEGIIPGTLFHAISVELTDRAAGFQVAWTTEESRTKILIFSTTGASLAPGNGPIAKICYAVGADVRVGEYVLRYGSSVVADPSGKALPPCPTFDAILARICVGSSSGCDLNGDGRSDILDIIRFVWCALGVRDPSGDPACPDSTAADCTGDGVVNVRDVICCVGEILARGGFTPGGGGPDSTGATRIGFEGTVRWINPADGRATVMIEPGSGFGGIQFGIDAGASPVRIRSVNLAADAVGVEMRTKVSEDGKMARAILYAVGVSPSGPLHVEVELESATGISGPLRIVELRSGTLSAREMATVSPAPTLEVQATELPATPVIAAARPNPFVSETEINYALPSERHVVIRVYSANGRLLRTLVDAIQPAGVHHAAWNGRDAAGRDAGSGIYFAHFSTGDVEKTVRLLRLR